MTYKTALYSGPTHRQQVNDEDDVHTQRAAAESNGDTASMTATTTTTLADCDDLLHQQALKEGRKDGRQAAEEASFKEGLAMGQVTGVDYGMEIGFAIGLVDAVNEWLVLSSELETEGTDRTNKQGNKETTKDDDDATGDCGDTKASFSPPRRNNASNMERIQKSVHELEAAITDFPRIQDFFQPRHEESEDSGQTSGSNKTQAPPPSSLHSTEQGNIREALQRIRARTKVLTAKLGIPHHSLKHVLQEQAALRKRDYDATDAIQTANGENATTNEW